MGGRLMEAFQLCQGEEGANIQQLKIDAHGALMLPIFAFYKWTL